MRTDAIAIKKEKERNFERAVGFARTLRNIQTPKRTVIISIMGQYGLKVRKARAAYKEAKKKIKK
jgi:hypothetical protein